MRLGEPVANPLVWLPLITDPNASDPTRPRPPDTSHDAIREACSRAGLRVLAVRWPDVRPMSGCLLASRFASPEVAERVAAAAQDVVRTMGRDWRMT